MVNTTRVSIAYRRSNCDSGCSGFCTVLLSALVAGALVACESAGDLEIVGTLERHRLELSATANEPITELLVREGDRVAKDAILVRQDPEALAARLDGARSQVAAAQAHLDELVRGPRVETLAEARARLIGAQAQRDRDQRELARMEDLVAKKLVSASVLDSARATRDRSVAQVNELNAQLLALRRGTRSELIAQARAAVRSAEAALQSETLSDRRLLVRAPTAGIVEALPYRVGERPPAGAPLVIMLEDAAPFARVYVPEPLKASMVPGTKADVMVDGVATPLVGTVRYLAAEASFTPYYALTQRDRGRLVYLCEIELDAAAAGNLPVGVPLTVRRVLHER